jgi:uncharacterized protein involved in oxidation of intracellular sulfur
VKVLIIINDAPYGSEKAYNALRIALQLQKEKPRPEVMVFLMADASGCAVSGQNVPQGYYNIETMLSAVIFQKGKVKICGSCASVRGIKDVKLVGGAELSNMSELGQWILESDKVLTF